MTKIWNELDDAGLAAFARDFLARYGAAGFGRLPKREMDVLILHLLERHTPEMRAKTDTSLAISLGTTPSRVRSWRTDARYLYWTEEEQGRLIRDTVFGAIALDSYVVQVEQDSVVIELHDSFVKEQVVDILRRNHLIHDSSFNSSLVKLSREALWCLVGASLDQERVEVLLKSPEFRVAVDRQGLLDNMKELTIGTVNSLADAGGAEAIKSVAKLLFAVA